MKFFARFFAIAVGLACFANTARCDSTFPYAKLYNLFQRGAKITSPNVRPIFVVASKDKSIKPGSIRLTIQAKSGPISVKIDPDGEIRGFPLTPQLLAENPSVLTNQAKGTLMIGAGMGLVLPDSLTFSYAQLNDLLDTATAEMKKAAGVLLSFMVPKPKGIIFEFSPPRRQTVTVAYKSGPKILRADSDGGITLPIDKSSLAENPAVTFSEKPLKVSVDM